MLSSYFEHCLACSDRHMINRLSAKPLYQQLHEMLRTQILEGCYQPDEAIPPEETLAENHEVSRVTIRKAIQLLVDEGLVVRQPGKGTYVSTQIVEEKQRVLRGFAELMAEHPQQMMEVLSMEVLKASTAIAAQLNLSRGDKVLCIKRRHCVQKQPIALAIIYLPYRLGRVLTLEEISTRPIYDLITSKTPERIEAATQRISATAADEELADLLEVELHAPLLLVRRVTRSTKGDPLEYIQLFYPGGKHELVMELHRDL